MKLFGVGLWLVIVALATAYARAVVLPGMAHKKDAAPSVLQYTKSRVLNVPIIAGGLVCDKNDVLAALSAGATAIASSNVDVWSM